MKKVVDESSGRLDVLINNAGILPERHLPPHQTTRVPEPIMLTSCWGVYYNGMRSPRTAIERAATFHRPRRDDALPERISDPGSFIGYTHIKGNTCRHGR